MSNYFDRFDNEPPANYFDRFDGQPAPAFDTNRLARETLGLGEEYLSGLGFGGSDELGAMAATAPAYMPHGMGGPIGALSTSMLHKQRGIAPQSPTYNEAYANTADRRSAFREEFPLSSLMANMAGGVTQSLYVPGLGTAGAIGRTAVAGGEGAATGALEAEPGQRLQGALLGGTLGALFQGGAESASAVLDVAMPTVKAAWNGISQRLTSVDAAVGHQGRRILDNARTSANELAQRMVDQPGPANLAMQDEQLLQVARYAAERGGNSRRLAEELAQMTRGAGQRLQQWLSQNVGNAASAAAVKRALLEARQTSGNQLYERAFQAPVELTPRLRNIWNQLKMRRGFIRNLREQASLDFLAEFKTPMNIDVNSEAIEPTVKGWQAIINWLNKEAINDAGNASTYRALRRDIVDDLVEQVPDFKAARQFWRGNRESEELVDLGYQLIANPKPSKVNGLMEDIRRRFGRDLDFERNPLDRELVALGVAEALEDSLSMVSSAAEGVSGRPGNDVAKRLFDKQAVKDALTQVFGKDSADDLYRWVSYEMNLKHQSNALTHAAGTSRQQGVRDLVEGTDIEGLDRGIFNALRRSMGRMSDDVLDEIGVALLTTDKARQQRFLNQLKAKYPDRFLKMPNFRQMVPGATGVAGGQAGADYYGR